jgi:hypothetical protein
MFDFLTIAVRGCEDAVSGTLLGSGAVNSFVFLSVFEEIALHLAVADP